MSEGECEPRARREGNTPALARTLASSLDSIGPLEGLGRAGLESEQELPGCRVENVPGGQERSQETCWQQGGFCSISAERC